MNTPFTLKEYIAEHKLGVADRDRKGMKMVADHLVSLGYQRRRMRRVENEGKAEFLYEKNDRKAELDALTEKLKALAEVEKKTKK